MENQFAKVGIPRRQILSIGQRDALHYGKFQRMIGMPFQVNRSDEKKIGPVAGFLAKAHAQYMILLESVVAA